MKWASGVKAVRVCAVVAVFGSPPIARADEPAPAAVAPSAPPAAPPSGEAAAEPTYPVDMVYYRSAVPARAVEASFSVDYGTWLGGSLGSANVSDVFSAAPGFTFEAGYRLAYRWLFVLGWEHMAWGVGNGSPYTSLQSASASGNTFYVAARLRTSLRRISPLLDAGIGLSSLSLSGQDRNGGTASADVPAGFALRIGGGASIRVIKPYQRQISIEPMAHLMFASTGAVESTVSPAMAGSISTTGATGSGLRTSFTIGIGGAFDLPLTWE